ncbi:unnamed protein product [Brachionus calyciflorus]|uniref:CCHC-type domain-containing protein n=1 Tax=Brachionus calyciflorus TaxID=104777 RepID=A0A814M697_9BILA|nr:unnamed protein product [Brachionus calyciflorus]
MKEIVQDQVRQLDRKYYLTSGSDQDSLVLTDESRFDAFISECMLIKKNRDKEIKELRELRQARFSSESVKIEPRRITTTTAPVVTEIPNKPSTYWEGKIPVFRGTEKENIEEWILVVETMAENNDCPLESLVKKIVPFIKDNALRSYLNWKEETRYLTWESLKSNFYEIYNTLDSQYKLKLKLGSFKITSLNFEENIVKFSALSGRLANKLELEKICYFLKSIPENARHNVSSKEPKRSYKARQARPIDYKNRNSVNTKYKGTYQYNEKIKSGNNNYQKNYSNSSNRYNNKSYRNNNETNKIVCYNCNKAGPTKKECRSKIVHKVNIIEEVGDGSTVRTIATRNVENVYVCSSGKILKVNGYLVDSLVKFSLDSGANRSVISLDTVKRLGLKINPSNIQIKIADNSINNVIGVSDKLKIKIGCNEIHLELLVIHLEDNEVLLGLDWFMETGAGIVPLKRSLTFPSDKIDLEFNDNDVQEDLYDEVAEIFVSEATDEQDIIEDDWPIADTSSCIRINAEHKLEEKEYKLFRQSLGYVSDLFAYSARDLKTCNKGKN